MRRHKLDFVSLVFGLLFMATGALFLAGSIELGSVRVAAFWPVLLVLAGLAILLSARKERGLAEIETERER